MYIRIGVKGKVIWNRLVWTYPEGASEESDSRDPVTGFLALRGNAFIDTFAEPDVGFHVP